MLLFCSQEVGGTSPWEGLKGTFKLFPVARRQLPRSLGRGDNPRHREDFFTCTTPRVRERLCT